MGGVEGGARIITQGGGKGTWMPIHTLCHVTHVVPYSQRDSHPYATHAITYSAPWALPCACSTSHITLNRVALQSSWHGPNEFKWSPPPLPHSLLLSLRRRGFNPPQPGLVEAPLWQLPDAVVVARSSAWWTRKTFSRAALQKHTPRTFKGPKLLSSKPDKNFDGCFKIDPNVNILQKNCLSV